MYIKSVIKPIQELELLRMDDSVEDALKIIDEKELLSLPVVNGKEFIGILSKRYIYQTFFEQKMDRETFLKLPVKDFMKTKVPTLEESILVEEAMGAFIRKPYPFIPVVDENDQFVGIITRKAVMERYEKVFKSDYPRLIIYTYDFKGKLSRIIDIITRSGGDIKNIAQLNTGVLGLQEVYLRIKTDDIGWIARQLKQQNFNVKL